jgi:hypothetical protein
LGRDRSCRDFRGIVGLACRVFAKSAVSVISRRKLAIRRSRADRRRVGIYLDEEIGGISVADRRRSSDSLAGRLRECGKRRGDRELVLAFVGDPAGDRGNESLLGRDLDCPAPRPALRSVIKSE